MEQYTASNGITVTRRPDASGLKFAANGSSLDLGLLTGVTKDQSEALREFFRAEEDERLGRWRWPENPDYVVYPDGTSRRVVRDSDGQSMQVSLHDRKVMETYLDSYVGAARAFDVAHPEPKGWRGAEPGEVWDLDLEVGGVRAVTVASWGADGPVTVFRNPYTEGETRLDDDGIRDARRVWPEEAS